MLCTLVKREKKSFQVAAKTVKGTCVTDLACSLVTSSRPPGRLQTRPDDRTWNAGVAVRTADGRLCSIVDHNRYVVSMCCARPSAGPDLSVWRPWVGSLLVPLPTLKCYNLHALTIVIITKYIYIYFYTL